MWPKFLLNLRQAAKRQVLTGSCFYQLCTYYWWVPALETGNLAIWTYYLLRQLMKYVEAQKLLVIKLRTCNSGSLLYGPSYGNFRLTILIETPKKVVV